MSGSSTLVVLNKYLYKEHLRTTAGHARVIKGLAVALRGPRSSLLWITLLFTNKLANTLLRHDGNFAAKPFGNYLNKQYEFDDRIRTIISHYEFVTNNFRVEFIDSIYFSSGL